MNKTAQQTITDKANQLSRDFQDEVNRLIRSGALPDSENPPLGTVFRVALENMAVSTMTCQGSQYKNLKKM